MTAADTKDPVVQKLLAARRLLGAKQSRDQFFRFMQFMHPDTEHPDDAALSEYKDTRHGRLLCDLVEKVEKGDVKKFAISIPPQHGKTMHVIHGAAWIAGRDPKANIMVLTYNEVRAQELGKDFRKALTSRAFKQIFPNVELTVGSRSSTAMQTTQGGKIHFVGLDGTVTGRTGGYIFIDDPIKGEEEAASADFREKLWKWFFAVAYSRGSKRTRIGIIHTRWNQDDLIGRLCDPEHPEHSKRYDGISREWLYLNLSGVIEDQKLATALGLELKVQTDPTVMKAFGRKPMAALWEDDKDLNFFAQWKIGEPETFNALVMGRPGTDDGDFFKAESLVEYGAEELEGLELEYYAASDHATSVKKRRDYTCLGVVGVDRQSNIWVMPDLVWERMETDRTVEEIIMLMRKYPINAWWMESDNIAKSFGPFLLKRMDEQGVYVPIDDVIVSQDKRTMARSISGRISMKKVRFPRFAPWWQDAKNQMLRFDKAPHDDFVSFMSHIGLGLLKQHAPDQEMGSSEDQRMDSAIASNVIPIGSRIEWILKQTRLKAERDKIEAGARGW